MSNVEFSDAYPSHRRVVIPEFFKRRMIAGLIPGDIIFPDEDFFTYEAETEITYVDVNRRLREEDLRPSDMTNRAGLTRIRGHYGGEFMRGYLADFRNLECGSIVVMEESDLEASLYPVEDELDTDEAELDELTRRIVRAGHRELLAATFNDPDDRPCFVGHEALKPVAIDLMGVVDRKIQETQGVSKAPKMEIPAEERAITKLKRQQDLKSKDRRTGT